MRLISTFHICALALLIGYGVLSAHQPKLYTTMFWAIFMAYSAVVIGIFRWEPTLYSAFRDSTGASRHPLGATGYLERFCFSDGTRSLLRLSGYDLCDACIRADGHRSIDCRARSFLGASSRGLRLMTHNPPLEPMTRLLVFKTVSINGSAESR